MKIGIYIAPGRKPWPHELRVAEILSLAGHYIEFSEEGNLYTADIKNATKQSPNLIIDYGNKTRSNY